MAGKKGMKHARPRTQEEKDKYALARIEELLDDVALKGKEVESWNPIRLQALKIRYDKLRAQLSASTITEKRELWTDFVSRAQDRLRNQQVTQDQRVAGSDQAQDEQTVH